MICIPGILPKLAVPISNNIVEFLKLIIQILLFTCFFIYFQVMDLICDHHLVLFLIPLLFLQCSILAGFGLLLSSPTTRYRDLNFLGGYINSFWMYCSPVVYPLSVIPENGIMF